MPALQNINVPEQLVKWGILIKKDLFYVTKRLNGELYIDSKYIQPRDRLSSESIRETDLICKIDSMEEIYKTLRTSLKEMQSSDPLIIQKTLLRTLICEEDKIEDKIEELLSENDDIFSESNEKIINEGFENSTKLPCLIQ